MKNLITILIAIAIGFIATYFLMVRPLNKDKKELIGLRDSTIFQFDSYRKETGEQVLTQQQVIASLENAIAAGIVSREELTEHNLRQVDQIIRLRAEIKRLIEAPYVDTPVIIKVPAVDTVFLPSIDTMEYLRIPQQFKFEDDWMTFNGIVHRDGVTLEDFIQRTGTDIFTGYQSRGFLRRAEPVVIVEYSNPYMEGVGVENVTIRNKPPWYNRPNFYRIQGAVAFFGASWLVKKLND